MKYELQRIPEWHDVDKEKFEREIVTQYRPAVLKGLVANWPSVREARKSPGAICNYLHAFDNGSDIDAVMVPPDMEPRVAYTPDMSAFNFLRNRRPISQVLEQLSRYAAFPNPPAVAVQSASIPECLPGFVNENPMPLLSSSILPRIWIGNALTVPAHLDESSNIACVVAGKRRFTLFPPEQAANLYLGPIDFNPTGCPISMVSFRDIDFEKYPKFREALDAALVAELEPGDAIYIPTLWWHQVESLEVLNILVNYWWPDMAGDAPKPGSVFDSLMHCILNMKDLKPEHKKAWAALFDHYVFDAKEDLAAHIPDVRKGILGKTTVEQISQIKTWLIGRIQR